MKRLQESESAWVKKILAKYETVENLQPHSHELEKAIDESPPWVKKLWKVILNVSHPGLNVQGAKNWTTKDLGQFLGRQCALEGVIWNEVPLSPRVEREKKKWLEHQAEVLKAAHELAKAYEVNTPEMKKWRPIFKRFIDETFADARRLPYQESSAFLLAFAEANHIKPDDLASEHTMGVGEKLAYVMILYWQHIAKFQSVGELHRFLQTAAKPQGVVITLKRVEKLCQRIGLKFKGRGRPKKIQTKPPLAS